METRSYTSLNLECQIRVWRVIDKIFEEKTILSVERKFKSLKTQVLYITNCIEASDSKTMEPFARKCH